MPSISIRSPRSMVDRITLRWLRLQWACRESVDIFLAEWPNGADVTRENLRRAVALGLDADVDWIARKLLAASAYREYIDAMSDALADFGYPAEVAEAKYKRTMIAALETILFPQEETL